MHLSSWLLVSVTYLSAGVAAFYPYKFPDIRGDSDSPSLSSRRIRNRFYPFLPPGVVDNVDKFTMDIRKGPRPTKVRRANNYDAVLGLPPTMPNGMSIHNDGHDYSYFSVVKFGSAGQEMWMLLDTGAANTWVMGTNCTTQACLSHNTFGIEDSISLVVTDQEWAVTYGTGNVNGIIVKDTMSFAGFTLNPAFGSVHEASEDFVYYPMDGILGLGLADPENTAQPPTVMQVIKDNQLLQKNIIGINLQRNSDGAKDGQISFGAIDHSKFSEELRYTKVVPDTHRWEIPVEDAFVDGKNAGFTGKSAIVDTGTSFILMPGPDATVFHALIPGSVPEGESFKLPCDTNAVVEIAISGFKFSVSPKDYVGDATGSLCHSRVAGHRPFGDNQWLLGDVFLKNVYAVFDFDEHQIGFSPRNATAPTSTDGSFSPSSTADPTAPGSSTETGSGVPISPGGPGPEVDGAVAGFSIPISLALVTFAVTCISWLAF